MNSSTLNTLRLLLFVPHCAVWLYSVIYLPFHFQFVFMTFIGNTTSVVATALTIQINNKDKGIIMQMNKIISKLLYEFSFGMQIMITVVYWLAVHAWLMKKIAGQTGFIVFNYFVHTLPLANILFNVTFSNIRFKYSHIVFTIFMSLIFFVFNYFGVIHFNNGEPFYPFFPWVTDFEKSVINAVILMLIASLVYLATCLFVNRGLRQPVF